MSTPEQISDNGAGTPDAIVEAAVRDPLIHLARCLTCDFRVQFRPLRSAQGFILVDSDQVLGIGRVGYPICPNGHGEMVVADDSLSAADAIRQVAAQLPPQDRRLPFPVPPFNFEGAWHEIKAKRKEVREYERRYERSNEIAKSDKKILEGEQATMNAMIDEYARREQERDDQQEQRDAKAADCLERADDIPPVMDTVTEASPAVGDGQPATIAADEEPQPAIAIDAVWAAVYAAGQILLPGTIEQWTEAQRVEVDAWARGVPPSEGARPAILGTPHVAPNGYTSATGDGVGTGSTEYQCCETCGARIKTINWEAGDQPYETGARVGTDCPGADVRHRYPEKKTRVRRTAQQQSA